MNKVTLTLNTTYNVYVTVSVSVSGFNVASRDSDPRQFSGSPSPTFVVPEYPEFIILPLFLAALLLIAIVHKRKENQYDATRSHGR
jgi:hypothetical protein